MALIESGLAADPDLDTDGMLKLNQAAIFNLKGKRDQAVSILGELIVDENTTASVCAIAKGIMFDLHQDQSR